MAIRARACTRISTTGDVMMDDNRALYVISVAAELAGVHPQTLRIYERKGLLSPARTTGRSRRYSDRDIALLRRIQELTTDGVTLAGVQRILDLESQLERAHALIDTLRAQLDELSQEMDARVAAAHRQYRREIVPLRTSALVKFEGSR
jgi:MerR family transcriptional regulator/heat shock protein HspR